MNASLDAAERESLAERSWEDGVSARYCGLNHSSNLDRRAVNVHRVAAAITLLSKKSSALLRLSAKLFSLPLSINSRSIPHPNRHVGRRQVASGQGATAGGP